MKQFKFDLQSKEGKKSDLFVPPPAFVVLSFLFSFFSFIKIFVYLVLENAPNFSLICYIIFIERTSIYLKIH